MLRAMLLALVLPIALLPVALAQGLADLPPCAATCAQQGLAATGCNLLDVGCICRNSAFINSLVPCIKTGCSQADQEKTIQFAQNLCAGAQVTLSNAGALLSASGSAMGSATSMPASAMSGATSMSGSVTSTASSSGASMSSMASTGSSASSSGSASSSPSSSATSSGSAAASASSSAAGAAPSASAAASKAAAASNIPLAGGTLLGVLLGMMAL